MGLSVKVYQNIKEVKEDEDYDFQAYVIDKDWEYKIKNLNNYCYYTGDCVFDDISYPYSQHGLFRGSLLKVIGLNQFINEEGKVDYDTIPEEITFGELIHFADNEGCLDFEVSEKLYKEFLHNHNSAINVLNDYEYVNYVKWMRAFDLARNNGVVCFR